jgi:excisionase family DNA binding protein
MQKEILNIKQASDYLKLTTDNIYRMTSEKRIPFYKPSKHLLFDRHQLDQWLEEKAIITNPNFSNFKN